jgi:hypothetical protein
MYSSNLNNKSTNSIVIGSQCVWVDPFTPPTIDLSNVTYDTIGSMITGNNYIPTLIPGGDYTIITNNMDISGIILSDGGTYEMDADRCRHAWRLSNYVRSTSDHDPIILKIAYNAAAALVYSSKNNSTLTPTGLSLSVNINNLTADNNGYSGDMVPPLIALIDALQLINYPLDNEITEYAFNIKKQLTNGKSISDILPEDIQKSNVYPILDSVIAGGQQLGLSGCGFVCTHDFFGREHFNILRYFDCFPTTPSTGIISPLFTDNEFDTLIKLFKMAAFKGNGYHNYADWPSSTQNYAESLLNHAYLTNIRIRNVNISFKDELSFGPNYQNGFTISTDAYPDCSTNRPTYSSTYKPTYFTMLGLPDSGWGSLTIEIISYWGVIFAAMNDYKRFCQWHRTYYYLLFVQNGGDMFSWADNEDDKINPILSNTSNLPDDAYWKPEYLVTDNNNTTWCKTLLDNKLRAFTINKWPPENVPSTVPNTSYNLPKNNNSNTAIWANRLNPYRGNPTRTRWSTPSYCMGYSPAWVAGGKTDVSGIDDNEISRPIAEALNPYFITEFGLYSATDGDSNALQAYLLAMIQWPTVPDLGNISPVDIEPPKASTNYTGTPIFGYDCDVSEWTGVQQATTEFDTNPVTNPINNRTVKCMDKIGYGVADVSGNNFIVDTSGVRCTTWKYMANAIQQTMISKNGHGNYPSTFGNFLETNDLALRTVTLGHDTGASSKGKKLDYIDLRLYQLLSNIVDTHLQNVP